LRIYAQLELGIAVFGFLILFAVPALGRGASSCCCRRRC